MISYASVPLRKGTARVMIANEGGVRMEKVAVLRIEIRFSRKLLENIEAAKRQGEKTDLDHVLRTLRETYAKELKKDFSFLATLRTLDPHVEIKVITSKLGGKNGKSEDYP